ncbi:hypothetical protein C8Q74DRAFT_1363866 [Fomes fomentarius]|nr:hypothetical protein C8Q74DRAFT_1363866 [Fomes fomentarius]
MNARRAWVDYLQGLSSQLEFQPDGAIAHDPTLLHPLISSVAHCPTCARTAYRDAAAVANAAKEAIDRVVAEVKLVFEQ